MAQNGNLVSKVWFFPIVWFIIFPADEVGWGPTVGQRPSVHASARPSVLLVRFPSILRRTHGKKRLVSQMQAPLAACREPAGKFWQRCKVLYVFNPRPLRPKGYCRHLRLSVCPSVCLSFPIILVNTITQSVYPISPPNLLGGFNMALPWMVL